MEPIGNKAWKAVMLELRTQDARNFVSFTGPNYALRECEILYNIDAKFRIQRV